MNKIKSLFLAAALVLGLGSVYAFAVDDEAPCFVIGSIGYELPYTPDGTPPDPNNALRLTGTYQPTLPPTSHRCTVDPSEICRYVYAETEEAPEGRWFTCTGLLQERP